MLVDIGEVTVGGTLSAGGVGTTSHRYGAQVGQVEQLDVVTGTGERVRCSATRNVELFDAVRSGQGQFGIITEAWIRLRPAGRRFRQYELHYRDAERFADALERIVEADRFDHLRAEFRNDENLIVLNAGIEYDEEPDDGRLLARLGHDKHAYTRDTASVGRAAMYPPRGVSAGCIITRGGTGSCPGGRCGRCLPSRGWSRSGCRADPGVGPASIRSEERRSTPRYSCVREGNGHLVFDPRQTG